MGYSWVLQGHLDVNDLAAFRASKVDPTRYEWPDTWGEPNESDAWTVEALTDFLESDCDAKKIEWTKKGVELLAIFSNDSGVWLDMRSHVASIAHVAAEHGGAGDIAFTGYVDGGPSDVYRVTASRGKSAMEVLTARAAKPVAKRMQDAAEPLVEAVVASLEPRAAPGIPKSVATIHSRVCNALREKEGDAVLRQVASAHVMVNRGKRWDYLQGHFKRATELIDAIERGWDGIDAQAIAKLPTVALRVLGALDKGAARKLASAYVALPDDRAARPFTTPIRAEAQSLLTEADTPKACMTALRKLRSSVPKSPHFSLFGQLQNDPAVRGLCERKSNVLRDATRETLVALTGMAPKLKKLAERDQVYAYALSLVLESNATPDDMQFLFRLWTESAGFQLLDHMRIVRSDAGKAYMASLWGRSSKSHYAGQEQQLAAEQALALDPKRALEVTKKLVAKKKLGWDHEFALWHLFDRLAAEKTQRKDWIPILREATKFPSEAGDAATGALVAWKERGASALVVDRLAKGTLDVEAACTLLERAKDKTVRKALEAWAAKLPKNAMREKNRVAQCIKALK